MKLKILSLSLIGIISITVSGCSNTQVSASKKPRVQGCYNYSNTAAKSGSVLSNGIKVIVTAWGHDETDNSQVGWNQEYPSPCFDDDQNRKGKPNAAWQGNFYLEDNKVCFTANNLYSKFTPYHTLAGGYNVAIENGTFKDGSMRKTIPLFKFNHKPTQTNFKICEEVIVTNSKPK